MDIELLEEVIFCGVREPTGKVMVGVAKHSAENLITLGKAKAVAKVNPNSSQNKLNKKIK